jgi:hypothetical protein
MSRTAAMSARTAAISRSPRNGGRNFETDVIFKRVFDEPDRITTSDITIYIHTADASALVTWPEWDWLAGE